MNGNSENNNEAVNDIETNNLGEDRNNENQEKLTEEKDKYFSLVLVLSSVCFLTMLFLLIQVNRSNKSKNEA